ncbi:hypothetical protein CLV71_12242 [Actinophytocola oryzae]|uniref:Peptidase C14 caspase domain-containing protein n=1 Tax=Actinophytocola oryzae TaxID=502181 RepID=A0A4R7UX09_9PSEU|nr:hypothetical protein CLV71_12242 [Actinophytocola oryzae]
MRNNLADLRAVLTHSETGIIAPENCSILEEPQSPHAFLTRLKREIRGTNDFLLVYYSGHGLRDDAGDRLYLTVGQTDRDELDGSAVAFDSVKRALENSPSRASLLVLDCCFSGMAAGIMSDGEISQWELEIRGSAVLASSPRNRTSLSPPGHRHTAFTGEVIRLLERGSPISGEPLTVSTLYKRVSVELARANLPEPKLALTETSGDLLVRRHAPRPPRRAPQAAPMPAPVPPSAPLLVPPPTVEAMRPSHSAADKWLRLTGLRVLWILAGSFLAMFLGGLVGTVTGAHGPDGTAGDDLSTLWIGLVLTLVSGVPLWFMRARWLLLRRELAPPLITRSVVGCVVVWSGLALSALVLGVSVFGEPSPGSSAMTITGIVVLMSEVAGLCGYLLLSRRRSTRLTRAALSR